MTLYSCFSVVNIATSSGFQRPTSPKVLHHKQHQSQVLSLQRLKRSMFISKFSFVAFFLSVDRPCHLEPFISLVNEAKQRGEITERVSTMPLYEMVIELLAGIGARYVSVFSKFTICTLITPFYRNFKCAHNFSSDGLFVNPGKAAADGIGVSDNRVVVAGGRISIIFISNSCVAACNLFIPGTTGSGTHINRIKKIGIWPLNEEFDALTTYFGAVYSVSQFYCNFFGDILTFQTLKEKTSSSNNSGPSCMSLPAFFFLIAKV